MEYIGAFIAGILVGVAIMVCWCAVLVGDENRYGGDD